MRPPSHALFRFIKKMSPSEKRYFKRFGFSNQKDANQYMLVFNAINNQKEYNEKALLQQFEGYTFTNNFSEIKKYLYQQLQRVMRLYNAQKSIDIVLYNHLSDIAVLYNKELYSDCEHLIRKATKLATRHEKFNILLLLNEWKRKVVRIDHHSQGIRDYLAEEAILDQEYIQKVKNESDYFINGLELMLMVRNEGRLNPVQYATPELPPLSFRAQRYLLWKRTQQGFLAWDDQMAFEANKKDVLLFEEHPHFIEAMPKQYVVALSNTINSSIDEQQEIYIEKALKTLNKYPFNIEFKLKEELLIRIVQLSTAIKSGALARAIEHKNVIDNHLKVMHKKKVIDLTLQLYAEYEFLKLNILNNEFPTALNHYNSIRQLETKKHQELMFMSTRLMGILIHYHFQNWLFLESLIRSTTRLLKLKFPNERLAFLFVETIKRCISIRISPNIPDEAILKELKKLKAEIDSFSSAEIREEYIIAAWVYSIVLKKPMVVCMSMMKKKIFYN